MAKATVERFLTNVKNWHKVRREQDFPNRQFYEATDLDASKLQNAVKEQQ